MADSTLRKMGYLGDLEGQMATVRLSVLLAVCVITTTSAAEPVQETPYRITHPANGITCFAPGVATSPNTTCVIETEKGLVVIDTGLSPSMGSETRRKIEVEMGRSDIRWVVNTHGHFDHTGGNQVFDDAVIIGHDDVPEFMADFFAGREEFIERRFEFLERRKTRAAGAAEGSIEAKALEETLQFNHAFIGDLRNGYRSTPPNLTFSDQVTLHAGDLEIRLIYFGRAHTPGDILVFVPQLKVVFTGDLFFESMLGVLGGGSSIEVPRWLEALDLVGLDEGRVESVIGGHGGVFDAPWLRAQHRYLTQTWSAANSARARGLDLEEFLASTPFDDGFSFISDALGVPAETLSAQHARILENFWSVAGSGDSQ